jgi:putative ABC transport system permease protein
VNLLASCRTAFRALRRNKLRSALAMVGIVIAVAAVIATVALGAGAQAKVAREMATLGSNMLTISPGAMSSRGASTGAGAVQTLTLEDGRAIERELAARVASVAPLNKIGAQVVYGDVNWFTSIVGSTSAYLHVRDWPLAEGEPFGKEEEASGAKVCLLGHTVKERLFGDASPVGEQVRVKSLPCRVVGVLAPKGQGSTGQDQDDIVLMPWATLARRIQGEQGEVVGQLLVGAHAPEDVAAAQRELTSLLRQRHRVAEGVENDFRVRNLSEIQNAAKEQSATLSLLLGSIALISLVVGAIGIANVMLVSVTERTREIGIRMAIGARGRDVLLQFLTEAVALAAAGGLVGIGVGAGATRVLATQAGWPVLLSPAVMIATVVLAGLAGVVAGFYPALRASRLDPIEALRFE